MCLIWLLILSTILYLNGVWLDMAPKMDTKKTWLKEIGRRVQNMITIMGLLVDMIERGEGGGDLYDHLLSTNILFLTISMILV